MHSHCFTGRDLRGVSTDGHHVPAARCFLPNYCNRNVTRINLPYIIYKCVICFCMCCIASLLQYYYKLHKILLKKYSLEKIIRLLFYHVSLSMKMDILDTVTVVALNSCHNIKRTYAFL